MDWDYILSLVPEDLSDEEKDDLYNTVTWFSTDDEDLDLQKSLGLLRVSQEVLKYKGEQVEILLHKLDEMATQQGEAESKHQESDTDARSTKSRKSSSLEFENLEERFLDLKSKFKKQVKLNDRNLAEIKKLQQKISGLEQEKQRLQHEMQLISQDDKSDISETVQDHNAELANTLRNKNKQISDLLRDIEETENENILLREKLANTRDELALATNEITTLTEKLEANKIELEDSTDNIKRLAAENESLQEELQEIQQQKDKFEQEMEEFTNEVNSRVNEWKRILDEKENEISDLKSQKIPSSQRSSMSDLPENPDPSQISLISKLLADRENQLMEVKSKLQQSVKEMEETSDLLKELNEEKTDNSRKIQYLSTSLQEMKKQLKNAHDRCRDLQDDLAYTENLVQKKDSDIKKILDSLNAEGHSELADELQEIERLKHQNRTQERQIIELVKTVNKLQDLCDGNDKENKALRLKFGLTEDDEVNTENVVLKQKSDRKEIGMMKKQLRIAEEEKLRLKIENRKLNKALNSASSPVNEAGDGFRKIPLESAVSEEESTNRKQQFTALVEENEALRKGLHEIMDSIKNKEVSTLTEIKSETLEKLLRALDVKHISGWYHPAMRLQAELHNQEGINTELREQLRLAKLEWKSLDSARSTKDSQSTCREIPNIQDSSGFTPRKQTLDHILAKIEAGVCPQENLAEIAQELTALDQEYATEKQNFIDKISECEEKINDLEESVSASTKKLKILQEDLPAGSLTEKNLNLVEENLVCSRKCSYLEHQVNKLSDMVNKLETESAEVKCEGAKKITELSIENKSLATKISMLTSEISTSIDPQVHQNLQKEVENLTIKYRDLLRCFENVKNERDLELKMSEEIRLNLQKDKEELGARIVDLLEKFRLNKTEELEDNLPRKLAESELREINERQRANHTNNLYELVKEQLQKSEERLQQSEKYSKEILQKNVVLQEQLKDCENRTLELIEPEVYKETQNRLNSLLKENDKLQNELLSKNREVQFFTTKSNVANLWNSQKQEELLGLQHLVVDLQSVSDDKSQIARLNDDLTKYKSVERKLNSKITSLTEELHKILAQNKQLSAELERKSAENLSKDGHYRKKCSVLRDFLAKSRLQYLGCVPLPSEEKFVDNIQKAIKDKHAAFINVYNSEIISNEASVLRELYKKQIANLEDILKTANSDVKMQEILAAEQEKKALYFNEIKYRRQAELKETQLQHIFDRVKIQDEQIIKLEEELFALHKNYPLDFDMATTEAAPEMALGVEASKSDPPTPVDVKIVKSREIQTDEIPQAEDAENTESTSASLKSELISAQNRIVAQELVIQQLKSKITEHEMNISLFRKQLGDKQSQISFYEKYIVDLQTKTTSSENKEELLSLSHQGSDCEIDDAENSTAKDSERTYREAVRLKEQEILKYQSLLKEDRDKHSMAASLMREELKVLHNCLADEKQKNEELRCSLENSHSPPSKPALEQYFRQVHTLENELSNLHTQISSLEAQLQASRQEAVRWRALANDRLESMQKLGSDLEDLHRNEIRVYKNESEKWRVEVNNLKVLISKYRSEMGQEFDVMRSIKEKDAKIHELSVMLRSARNEVKQAKNSEKSEPGSMVKLTELEFTKEQLIKEHETLKRRFDQLLCRERSGREEIRELKSKLAKKPILSARSDKSERPFREQLQKQISILKNDIVDLKAELNKQVAVNEAHRSKASEDFDKWNKMKHWQQTADKFKSKLKGKEHDFEKLQQTCAGYRILIERLERDKYLLENRLKSYKNSNTSSVCDFEELDILRAENTKLITENEDLLAKIKLLQHHAGGLGAAMLQEKLEAQERKIAILELSSKGTVEVRAELERLQNSLSSLQKINLRLEAENLELKLDLEKSAKEMPYMREQIQHLERYIEVLKKENAEFPIGGDSDSHPKTDSKKISELERTIFVLKRVVDKLQAENKRLLSGRRPYSASGDKLKRDYQNLKEQHDKLEDELEMARNQTPPVSENVMAELKQVREQLEMKSQLLDKVKVLLQRAANKEKALIAEVNMLKAQMGDNAGDDSSTDGQEKEPQKKRQENK